MKKQLIFTIAVMLSAIIRVEAASPVFTFGTGTDECVVTVCSDNILKIDYRPHGSMSPNTIVIDKLNWNFDGAVIAEVENSLTITTGAYKAVIGKAPFTIEVYDTAGKHLLGTRKPLLKNLIFEHDRLDNFYGLAGYNRDSYKDGFYPLTRNSGGIIEAQPQGGCGAPFIWSTSGYGIVLDTDGGNVSNANGQLVFGGCSKDNFEFYIIVGNPREIIASAGEIAGMPQMFPKWNVGFGQLEWGIDEAEFREHINGYRSRKIPLDWFMLDFDWMAWGEDNYGEFRWGDNFPGGANGKLAKWSLDNKVRMTAITKPRIIAKNANGTWTAQGRYAEDNGFWFPGEEFFPDYVCKLPSKDLQYAIPECQQWWWKHLKEGAFDKGMVGFLNDECDDSNAGGLYNLGNFSNIFMQKSIYEGQRASSDMRVWSVNRTAYMGSQKYAYSIWSGDNYPTFPDLRSQAVKMLAANNVLVPVWGFCITAFWNTAPVTEELYLRSMQLGMFSPLFFLHGIIHQQKQPWFFGDHVTEQSRKIVELRYKLIPYMYAYDRIKHETMIGISRALVIDWPEDSNVADISDSFMFGDWILASPVLEEGAATKEIYLPAGMWTDFSTGEKIAGARLITRKLDNKGFTDIPMYIREGGIIPNQDVVQYIGTDNRPDKLYIDVFPADAETSFDIYEDDGETYDYEKGLFFKQRISVADRGNSIIFLTQEGSYKPAFTSYIVKIHGTQTGMVTAGGKDLRQYKDYASLLKAKEGFSVGEDIYGSVVYIKTAVDPSGKKIILR